MTMLVGAAEVVITPPLGVEISGYGPRRRLRSTEVHRQLSAQALVFGHDGEEAALLVCDVVAVTPDFVDAVRSRVTSTTGIPAHNVMVAATHSHSSPNTGGLSDFGRTDAQYVRILARIVAGAVGWAKRNARPSRLFVGRSSHDGLAWNRTNDASVDDSVHTVHVVSEDGAVTAVLGQYACHPVILGPGTILSPDFPGAFRDTIRSAHPACVALFVNGACGDIDPVTNREVWGQGTVDDIRHHGERLAEAALSAVRSAEPVSAPGIGVSSATMRLDYDVPPADEVERRIAFYSAQKQRRGKRPDDGFGAPAAGEGSMPRFWLRYYERLERKLAQRSLADHELVELQALHLGADTVLVAIPAEVYSEHGVRIKEDSALAHTIPVCYANGCCGYLPPEREFRDRGYTATLAAAAYDRPPFRPDVAEVLVRNVRELLKNGNSRAER